MTTLTIWTGRPQPVHAVGKHQCRLLDFAERFRGWHSYADDRTTRRAIAGLLRRGAIQVNEHGQFRFIYD